MPTSKTVAQEFRERGDRAYCDYIVKLQKPECLGWEQKIKSGQFGEAELRAHERAAEQLGWHRAFYVAAELIEKTTPDETTEKQPVAWMGANGAIVSDEHRRSTSASRAAYFSTPLYAHPLPPFGDSVRAPVEPTCTCGSKDGLHKFTCQFRREGAVKASDQLFVLRPLCNCRPLPEPPNDTCPIHGEPENGVRI
jgi:hypothetical protein